jgi:hypothetical protein
LEQEFVVHGQLADLAPQPGDLVIPLVGRPALEGGLAAGQEVVPPGERVAAVTPSSRETSSRSSPPRRRSTLVVFRWEEKRPRSPGLGEFDIGIGSWVWTR